MTKAKHAFDSDFAPGDLFLESHDSHLASTYFAGILTQVANLPVATWIGRLIAWGLMSAAWIRFCRVLKILPLVSGLALASWIYAVHYGHWAGEWAIGGFEGKAIAYPCVLFAMSFAMEGRWRWTWIWAGLGVLWHPLVGGWAGLTMGIVWLFSSDRPKVQQIPWLILAAAIASIGVIPALSGLGGKASEGNIVASQIHVYYRLSHHLCAQTFSPERHKAAIATLAVFGLANVVWLSLRWTNKRAKGSDEAIATSATSESSTSDTASNASPGSSSPLEAAVSQSPLSASGRLLLVAWLSILIALCGLTIDLTLSRTDQAELASKLLRFYWFRWSDIAVPLAWTAVGWQALSLWGGLNYWRQTHSESSRTASGITAQVRGLGQIFLAGACILTMAFIGLKAYRGWNYSLPPADRLLVNTPGQLRNIKWEGVDSNRHRDWLAVCRWIRDNTPQDSLWLTPKHQQSFKWYAHRAEVVCWKDVPQDNDSLIEWYKRIVMLEPPRTPSGKQRGWNDAELRLLSERFGFEYVLVDRTYYSPQMTPPKLELLYPINIDNRSFAVFRIRPTIED